MDMLAMKTAVAGRDGIVGGGSVDGDDGVYCYCCDGGGVDGDNIQSKCVRTAIVAKVLKCSKLTGERL
jgi:hypothetical protein